MNKNGKWKYSYNMCLLFFFFFTQVIQNSSVLFMGWLLALQNWQMLVTEYFLLNPLMYSQNE